MQETTSHLNYSIVVESYCRYYCGISGIRRGAGKNAPDPSGNCVLARCTKADGTGTTSQSGSSSSSISSKNDKSDDDRQEEQDSGTDKFAELEPFVKDAGGVVSHSQHGQPKSPNPQPLSGAPESPYDGFISAIGAIVLPVGGHSGYGPFDGSPHSSSFSPQELADALCTLCRLCAFRGSPYSYTGLEGLSLSDSDAAGAVMGGVKISLDMALYPLLLRILASGSPHRENGSDSADRGGVSLVPGAGANNDALSFRVSFSSLPSIMLLGTYGKLAAVPLLIIAGAMPIT